MSGTQRTIAQVDINTALGNPFTIGGQVAIGGTFDLGLTLTGDTVLTLPTSGTLVAATDLGPLAFASPGAGLALNNGTLNATGGAEEWAAGTVTALGANLTLTNGTLSASGGGGGGLISAVGNGLVVNNGTAVVAADSSLAFNAGSIGLAQLAAGRLFGNSGTVAAQAGAIAVGNNLTLAAGTLAVSGLGSLATAGIDGSLVLNTGTLGIASIAPGAMLLNSGTVAAQPTATPYGGGLAVVSGTLIPVLGGGLILTNGSITANGTVGSVNLTSATGLLINGVSAINIDALNNTCVGFSAGNAAGNTGVDGAFFGFRAGASNTSGGENTFIGYLSGEFNTTGGFNTGCGEHTLGQITTESFNSAFGNDSGRNFASATGQSTMIGKSAMYSGGGSQSVAVGMQALNGNAANLTLTGTITTTDVISVTFTGAAFNGGTPVTVTAAMTGLTTLAQATTAIFAACTGNTLVNTLIGGNITSAIVASSLGVAGTSIAFVWAGGGTGTTGQAVIATASVSGSATEIVTITNGSVGSGNVALGFQSLLGRYMSSASGNVGIGSAMMNNLTTGSNNFAAIGGAGAALTSGIGNLFMGQSSGSVANSASFAVALGFQTYMTTTNGSYGVSIGYQAAKFYNGSSGSNNASVAIGPGAFTGTAGSGYTNNVGVGGSVAVGITTASNLTVLGGNAGKLITSGGVNLIAGANVASTTLVTGTGNILLGVDASTDTAAAGTNDTIIIKGRTGGIATLSTTAANTAAPTTIMGGILGVTPTAGITAHAGGGQASATALTTGINYVGTIVTAADSVKLASTAIPGVVQIVANGSASNAMQVFGLGTDTINGVATGTGVSVPAGKTGVYFCYTAGAWVGGTLN